MLAIASLALILDDHAWEHRLSRQRTCATFESTTTGLPAIGSQSAWPRRGITSCLGDKAGCSSSLRLQDAATALLVLLASNVGYGTCAAQGSRTAHAMPCMRTATSWRDMGGRYRHVCIHTIPASLFVFTVPAFQRATPTDYSASHIYITKSHLNTSTTMSNFVSDLEKDFSGQGNQQQGGFDNQQQGGYDNQQQGRNDNQQQQGGQSSSGGGFMKSMENTGKDAMLDQGKSIS